MLIRNFELVEGKLFEGGLLMYLKKYKKKHWKNCRYQPDLAICEIQCKVSKLDSYLKKMRSQIELT